MSSRSRLAAPLALTLSLGALFTPRTPADACGQCVEDKVAATYDHAVITRAAHDGHAVVFAEVRGPAAGGTPALKTFIAHALASTRGVDAGTVRVSLEPPAASFACDLARHTPNALLATVNPQLATKGLSLVVIKIDHGPQRDPAR
jgi:hypothetical protein